MTSSLADTLRVLTPSLPPTLITPGNLTDIRQVVRHLPGPITSFFGFECPLEDISRTDILLRITAGQEGQSILAGDSVVTSLPESIGDDLIWGRLQNFCRHWRDPCSVLNKNVKNIWLEFDITGSSPDIPWPSCFFGPQPLYAQSAQRWVIETALPLLWGHALPATNQRKLLACLAELPGQAHVFQIGIMLPRKTNALRLCILDIVPTQIPTYLTRLGWPGDANELATLIDNLGQFVDTIALDLDVDQTVLPKIGLECYFDHCRQPQHEPRWRSFLAYLTQLGMCCPSKQAGLLAYPGYVREKTQQTLWPEHLHTTSGLLGNHYESVFVKGIHHLKIVYRPDYRLQAKAYLYVGQGWLPVAAIKQQLDFYATEARIS